MTPSLTGKPRSGWLASGTAGVGPSVTGQARHAFPVALRSPARCRAFSNGPAIGRCCAVVCSQLARPDGSASQFYTPRTAHLGWRPEHVGMWGCIDLVCGMSFCFVCSDRRQQQHKAWACYDRTFFHLRTAAHHSASVRLGSDHQLTCCTPSCVANSMRCSMSLLPPAHPGHTPSENRSGPSLARSLRPPGTQS